MSDDNTTDPDVKTEGDVLGARADDGSDTSASKDPSDWVTGDEPMTGP